jgi:hypothetical protein
MSSCLGETDEPEVAEHLSCWVREFRRVDLPLQHPFLCPGATHTRHFSVLTLEGKQGALQELVVARTARSDVPQSAFAPQMCSQYVVSS